MHIRLASILLFIYFSQPKKAHWILKLACCNPNLGLVTKARACEGVNQEWNPGVSFQLLGVWESVRKWTPTLPNELPLWELESQWTPKILKSVFRGQKPLDWRFFYIIRNLLECRCLKWARMTHLRLKTQVMAKRRVRSQFVNLTLNH
jgi:hypothetical protein